MVLNRTTMMGAGVVLVALGCGAMVYGVGLSGRSDDHRPTQLIGDDFGRIRREALTSFPRGSPLASAADGLKALGFQCAPARHLLANINAPSVQCDSSGRGYPHASRLQVTVMARNGMVSDIAVGNGFDKFLADARTPDPMPERHAAQDAKEAEKAPAAKEAD